MVVKPGREAEVEAIFRKWELDFAVIGEVTDTGHMVLEFDGEVVCDIPLGPLADEAPLLRAALRESRQGAASRSTDVPESTRHRRGPAEADGLAQPRQPALDLGAIRPAGRRRHGAAPGRRRRGGARPRIEEGAGDDHRLHAALLLCRPGRGREAGGRRGLSQPLRGRREAAGDHQLPQLRQPAAARDHGPVRRLRRRHGRSLPRARLPGRERQRLALQRDQDDDGSSLAILPTPAIGGVGLLDDWEKSATIGFQGRRGRASRPARPFDRAMSVSRCGWRCCHGRREGLPPPVDLVVERRARRRSSAA